MADTAKRTAARKTKDRYSIPEGHSRKHLVLPDDLWSDMEKICEAEPLRPSVTRYIVAGLYEKVKDDKQRLGIID